jgi:hypothetical protein
MQDVFQCALSLGRKEEGRQGGNGRRGTNKNKVKAKTKEKATHHWLRGTAHTRLQAPYSHTITAQHLWN